MDKKTIRVGDMSMTELFELREDLRGQITEVRAYGNRKDRLTQRVALNDLNTQLSVLQEEIRDRMQRLNEKARQVEITARGTVMREPRQEMGLTLKSFAQLPGQFINRMKRRSHGKFSRRAAYALWELLFVIAMFSLGGFAVMVLMVKLLLAHIR